MRVARILGEGESFYHIVSRIVDRRLILDDSEKERFRKLMRAVETFSGCQILTWTCLDYTGISPCVFRNPNRSATGS